MLQCSPNSACTEGFLLAFNRTALHCWVFGWWPWVPMGSHGFLWVPLGSYGFLWVPKELCLGSTRRYHEACVNYVSIKILCSRASGSKGNYLRHWSSKSLCI